MSDTDKSDKSTLRGLGGRLASLLKQWLVAPLIAGIIGTLVIGRVINTIIQPKNYKIYFIGDLKQDSATKIWSGLYRKEDDKLAVMDGVPIVLMQVNDFGDERTAERISQDLANKSDTLMVIGHISSTQTRVALPAYLKLASPPVPVILTTETNPDLLPPSDDKDWPLYRLSPTDDDQAQVAACLAKSQTAKAIWVVEAGPNRVYTRYLAQKFIQQVQENGPGNVLLWSTSLDNPMVDAIRTLKIDWVYYAGDWANALVLVRQLRTAYTPGALPRIVLSDGAMDKKLLSNGGRELEGIYLTFAVPVERFNLNDQQYAVFGKDARDVVLQILNRTNNDFDRLAGEDRGVRRTLNWLLGLKRVADARNAIWTFMRNGKENEVFEIDNKELRFGKNGIPINRKFDVWQVRDGKFTNGPDICSATQGR